MSSQLSEKQTLIKYSEIFMVFDERQTVTYFNSGVSRSHMTQTLSERDLWQKWEIRFDYRASLRVCVGVGRIFAGFSAGFDEINKFTKFFQQDYVVSLPNREYRECFVTFPSPHSLLLVCHLRHCASYASILAHRETMKKRERAKGEVKRNPGNLFPHSHLSSIPGKCLLRAPSLLVPKLTHHRQTIPCVRGQ